MTVTFESINSGPAEETDEDDHTQKPAQNRRSVILLFICALELDIVMNQLRLL